MTPEPSLWQRKLQTSPGHSDWYVERFRTLARDGVDIVGEARTVDAMLARGSRVLDAGCGPGRVGAHLHAAGHTVVGIDGDPVLIAAAQADHPGPTWLVGDLAELDLPARGIPEPFDAVVAAGNVMPFLAPTTRREVLHRLARHLAPQGRLVAGFGTDRDYPVPDFLADAAAAGLTPDLLLATWELHPYTPDSDFVVAVLRREGE
ncbi:MAG TPA: methyltransferase domain-containing protein [Dermatophilaceae bacterium]|nr:methyltransferase domain-containing protein [Dermatophilaceae bacterium]